MLRIRIRINPHQFGKPDTDPHQSKKPAPDPHQSKKQGPDLHQSRLLEAVGLKIDLQMAKDAHNGCVKGQNGALVGLLESESKKVGSGSGPTSKIKVGSRPGDPQQVERMRPNPHESDADPQLIQTVYSSHQHRKLYQFSNS
jgi:hypothetical protein